MSQQLGPGERGVMLERAAQAWDMVTTLTCSLANNPGSRHRGCTRVRCRGAHLGELEGAKIEDTQ